MMRSNLAVAAALAVSLGMPQLGQQRRIEPASPFAAEQERERRKLDRLMASRRPRILVDEDHAAIAAAKAKRERKADKRARDHYASLDGHHPVAQRSAA